MISGVRTVLSALLCNRRRLVLASVWLGASACASPAADANDALVGSASTPPETSLTEPSTTSSAPALTPQNTAGGASAVASTSASVTSSATTSTTSSTSMTTPGASNTMPAVSDAATLPNAPSVMSSAAPSSSDAAGGQGGLDTEGATDTDAGAGGTGSSSGGAPGRASDAAAPTPSGTPPTVYIAGDSTVSTYADTASTTDQAGWGQMLPLYVDERVTIVNRAIGGRTARRFIDEGYLDEIAEVLSAGDSLLVQFGTNDGNKTAMYELNGQQIPYYLDPSTDFKTYLNQYIDLALDHDATPILVTPPPRNSAYCTGGNGTGGHAEAMRELAAERSVALSDLNRMSVDYLTAICPAPTPEDFFLLRADGSVDGTHFQENGARILAQFVADGISAAETPLADWLK